MGTSAWCSARKVATEDRCRNPALSGATLSAALRILLDRVSRRRIDRQRGLLSRQPRHHAPHMVALALLVVAPRRPVLRPHAIRPRFALGTQYMNLGAHDYSASTAAS